jgi:DHA2 family multidrug resistance protein
MPQPADAPAPLTGATLYIAALFLGLANFMVVLDTTIANVSVPHIAGALAVSPSQGTWVITSYSVAEAITVPLTGWLAQRFGALKVFLLAMVVSSKTTKLASPSNRAARPRDAPSRRPGASIVGV